MAPFFLFWGSSTVNEIISAQLKIYQRFFKYIDRNSKYISDFQDISICRQKSSNVAIYIIRGSVFHTPYKKQFNIPPRITDKKANLSGSLFLLLFLLHWYPKLNLSELTFICMATLIVLFKLCNSAMFIS